MKALLYKIIEIIAIFHDKIMGLNDSFSTQFTDKELHFLVMGILGMAMVFVIHPIFKALAKHNHVMVISWIYVFTLIVVIAFAIEIGQGYSHTGSMDFGDIVFGVVGFFVMFAVFAAIRGLVHLIINIFKNAKEDNE